MDISSKGLRFEATVLPPTGCTIPLELPLGNDAETGPRARVQGQVVWTSSHTAGMRFVGPEPDFLEQLRRLLRRYLLIAAPDDLSQFVDRLFAQSSVDRPHRPARQILDDEMSASAERRARARCASAGSQHPPHLGRRHLYGAMHRLRLPGE